MMMIDNIYPITHDGSMYGIYIYANKTGVFVDGKCDTIHMAYIHGSVMGLRPAIRPDPDP